MRWTERYFQPTNGRVSHRPYGSSSRGTTITSHPFEKSGVPCRYDTQQNEQSIDQSLIHTNKTTVGHFLVPCLDDTTQRNTSTMAAILCKSVANCCDFFFTAPCKLCGKGCEQLASVCTNPLSCFVAITVATQIPVAIAAALELPSLINCKASQWLLGMLLVALAHTATSIYLGVRVSNRTDEALRHKHTAWERVSYLLCHDPWIALYILVVFFYVGWLFVGTTWSILGIMDNGTCGSSADNRVSAVMVLEWIYFVAGPLILSCNLCCVCCDKRDYAGDDAAFAAKEAAKQQKPQQQNNNNSSGNYAQAPAPDIETPVPPSETKNSFMKPPPPRIYSADGVPVGDYAANEVMEAEAVVIDEIPPPMMPASKAINSKETTSISTAQTKAKAEEIANSVTKKVGGWVRRKTQGDAKPAPPDTKATLY